MSLSIRNNWHICVWRTKDHKDQTSVRLIVSWSKANYNKTTRLINSKTWSSLNLILSGKKKTSNFHISFPFIFLKTSRVSFHLPSFFLTIVLTSNPTILHSTLSRIANTQTFFSFLLSIVDNKISFIHSRQYCIRWWWGHETWNLKYFGKPQQQWKW